MRSGDAVRVYPHGDEKLATVGKIVLISENQRSIAVGFEDGAPFLYAGSGVTVHPDHGMILLAAREALDGVPWGPWVDLVGGGHYEIEET